MRCIYCNHNESKVIDSRPTEDDNSIRRRRECLGCGRRFTTYEKVEQLPLMVVKRDGRREAFDSKKLYTSIIRACEKLPVPASQIENIAERIERAAYACADGEVPTHTIGDMVMDELRQVNDVAYVRFAAVYRKFADLGTFMNELQKLVTESSIQPQEHNN